MSGKSKVDALDGIFLQHGVDNEGLCRKLLSALATHWHAVSSVVTRTEDSATVNPKVLTRFLVISFSISVM